MDPCSALTLIYVSKTSEFAMRFRTPELPFLSRCFVQLVLCFFVFGPPFQALALTRQQDVDALIALRTAWSSNPAWDTSTDPCDDAWLGVGCDSTNTQVVQLLLINRQLNGILPAVIGNLTNLTDLDLSSNRNLGGSLPTTIGSLSNLNKFFVQFCNFSGTIPSEIGNLANLQYFGLTSNSFTGSLPESIGLLTNVIWLDISSNFLSGRLPVSTSSVNGSGLDNLTNARHFHFQNNWFSGTIPSEIFNSQMQLQHILLHNNYFNGSIPSNLADLSTVKIVRFDSNNLTGSIPSTISSMKNLTTLELDYNALTGPLPNLSNNTNLRMLELGNNQFDASPLPAWVGNLTNLRLLSLQSANLNASVPSELFALPLISNVILGSNNLSGALNLTEASSTLFIVDATNNDISALDRGNYSQGLLLDGNTYCNSNPTMCNDAQSATWPVASPPDAPAILSCTKECTAEYAINPKVSGNCRCVRPVLGNVTFVATEIPILANYNISLMEQQFATGLSQYLVVYNLTFDESQVVVDVLSSFQITVSVFPPNTTALWHPNDWTLIAYALKNQYIGFPDIGPVICGFSGTPYDTGVPGNSLSSAAITGVGRPSAAGLVTVLLMAYYAIRQKRKAQEAEKQNIPFAAWIAASKEDTPDIPQLKGSRWFSLAEIRKCTNNFCQSNEIGEGGYGKVYKGCLRSGEQVAIKRAGANSLQGATEFKNEIELLSRVHHRNLVGLIGFCFEEGEQMLVYEYMPNGTLRESISGQSGIRMDWERRISFALGSARGITYLHTEANPPIIHRDIKSSNILLDDKLVPRVADFGLSKVAPNDGGAAPWSTDSVKGTLGYLDPEYFMMNRLSEKSDVYSFGVVLLELITSRKPIQGGKSVVRELRTAFEEGGMANVYRSLVDPNLTDYPTEGMKNLVELSLRCVNDKSDPRPRMWEVVKELEFLEQFYSDSGRKKERKEEIICSEGPPTPINIQAAPHSNTGSFIGRPGDSEQRLLTNQD